MTFAAIPALAAGSGSPKNFEFKDSVGMFKWSHTGNRLAVLTINDETAKQKLTIIDAAKKKVVKTINLPKNRKVTAFDWLADDKGFLMGAEVEPEIDAFFSYSIATGKMKPAHRKAEQIFAAIDDIVVEGKSGLWAASFHGEGHPDIAIYKGDKTILNTDVYPGSISLAAWVEGKLICYSSAYLELGLTRDERALQESDEKYLGHNDNVQYAIDPSTKKAETVSMSEDALFNTSSNGKYVVEYRSKEGVKGFTIRIK